MEDRPVSWVTLDGWRDIFVEKIYKDHSIESHT